MKNLTRLQHLLGLVLTIVGALVTACSKDEETDRVGTAAMLSGIAFIGSALVTAVNEE